MFTVASYLYIKLILTHNIMNRISKAFLACTCGLFCLGIQAQNHTTWTNDFSNTGETLKVVGRGTCSIADNVFRSKGSYALFGNPEWTNYSFSFKARAPEDAEQVQIWASFRNYNRFDRYVVGQRRVARRPLPDAYRIYGNR